MEVLKGVKWDNLGLDRKRCKKCPPGQMFADGGQCKLGGTKIVAKMSRGDKKREKLGGTFVGSCVTPLYTTYLGDCF